MCSVVLIFSSLKGYRNAGKARVVCFGDVHPLYAAEEAYRPACFPLVMVDELRFSLTVLPKLSINFLPASVS